MVRSFVFVALLCGCYAPQLPRCTITCGDERACPSDTTCGEDGYCHAAGDALCGPRFVQITAGGAHSCAVKDDHTLWCWGRGASGQTGLGVATSTGVPTQVGSEAAWAQVDAAIDHTCAVRLDGSMWCWGEGGSLQLADSSADRFAPLRVGVDSDWSEAYSNSGSTSCGRKRDGTLWLWGDGSVYVRSPADGAFVSAARGHNSSCGVRTDGALLCWGLSSSGALGVGDIADGAYSAMQVGTRTDWASVTVGVQYACALTREGALWCWGYVDQGRTGTGQASGVLLSPREVAPGSTFVKVSAGAATACAIDDAAALWCWGRGDTGEIGDGGGRSRDVPTRVDSAATWADVSVGSTHTCAVTTSGTAACWGNNDDGQLGYGDVGRSRTPARVGETSDWVVVAPGARHVCGIRAGGLLYCWGRNDSGQVGDGGTDSQGYPTQVASELAFAEVSAGGASTCATTVEGALYCFGNNDDGQLGTGASGPGSEQILPLRIGGELGWSSPAVGMRNACALRDGELLCWGRAMGQAPVRLGGDVDWRTVRGAQLDPPFQGLRGAGELWSIGLDGTLTPFAGPLDWQSLRVGFAHSCGLRPGGVLACRGENSHGQLGAGSVSGATQAELAGLWRALGAATFSTWAIADDGSLFGFGSNTDGALGGDSAQPLEAAPVRIGVARDWTAVAGGDGIACGLRGAGELWCWGSNSAGQLGTGLGGSTRPLPVVEW